MKLLFFLLFVFVSVANSPAKGRLMFDLSHGQFQDKFTEPGFYDYVIPGYKKILEKHGIEYVPNEEEITAESLENIDVLLMLSPLARDYQKPITEVEKKAITDFIRSGGSVLIFY